MCAQDTWMQKSCRGLALQPATQVQHDKWLSHRSALHVAFTERVLLVVGRSRKWERGKTCEVKDSEVYIESHSDCRACAPDPMRLAVWLHRKRAALPSCGIPGAGIASEFSVARMCVDTCAGCEGLIHVEARLEHCVVPPTRAKESRCHLE